MRKGNAKKNLLDVGLRKNLFQQRLVMFLQTNVLQLILHLGVVQLLNYQLLILPIAKKVHGVEPDRGEVMSQRMEHDVVNLLVLAPMKGLNGVVLILDEVQQLKIEVGVDQIQVGELPLRKIDAVLHGRNQVSNKKAHGDAVGNNHQIVEIVRIVNGKRVEKILGKKIPKIWIQHLHHHLENLRVF